MRRLRHAALLTLLAMGLAAPVRADEADVVATIQDRAAAHGVSASWLERTLRCESHLNPRAVGDGGASLGVAQLHARGLRPLFFQMGYSDPFNVWEAVDFIAWAFEHGYSGHWTCAR